MNFRKAAERLSRGIVLKRRLPAEFHRLPIYVSPEAGLRYWLRMSQVDPMLYRMVQELVKPGAHVWDVGANVGLFSFCAAALAGPAGSVLAIEPDVWLAHLIQRSSSEWKRAQAPAAAVSVVCAAISDHAQVSNLQISERCRAASHLSEARGSTQASGTGLLNPRWTCRSTSCSTISPLRAFLKSMLRPTKLACSRGRAACWKPSARSSGARFRRKTPGPFSIFWILSVTNFTPPQPLSEPL
jgi:FkbM family methyltransferase